MRHKIKILMVTGVGFLLTFGLTSVVTAAKKSTPQPVQKRPKVQQGERPEPVVTITENKESVIKEYRINGVLRAIKVSPKNGFPPYYLIDKNGTGEFMKVGPDVGTEFQVPQWILFEW